VSCADVNSTNRLIITEQIRRLARLMKPQHAAAKVVDVEARSVA